MCLYADPEGCTGWFYTLLVLSTHLFGKAPWKNLIVTGLVLAECFLPFPPTTLQKTDT